MNTEEKKLFHEKPISWRKMRRDWNERRLHDFSAHIDCHENQLKGIKGWFISSYYKFALKFYNPEKSVRTLEIGCGEGMLFKNEKNKPIQLDVSMRRLEKAKRFNRRLLQADGYNLPFRDRCFDCVFLVAILEHTREPQKILDEVARIIKADGLVIIVVPNDIWMTLGRTMLGQRPFRVIDHLTFFYPGKLRDMYQKEFITVVERSLPFPFVGFWFNMVYGCVIKRRGAALDSA